MERERERGRGRGGAKGYLTSVDVRENGTPTAITEAQLIIDDNILFYHIIVVYNFF